MNILKDNELIEVSNKNFILFSSSIEKSIRHINSEVSIIYFTENLRKEVIKLLDNKLITKAYVISKNCYRANNEKLNFASNINKRIVKGLSQNTLILVDLNDNYEYVKYVVENVNKLFKMSSKHNRVLDYKISETDIIASIIHNNSVYLEDILNAFKVIIMPTRREKYEFIYDTVCDFLDNNFTCKNICDFKNDQCVANRTGCTAHETMGCCYSFEYAGVFDFRMVKNVKLCQYMQNRKCATRNITCKLFTCKYLKNKNIFFDTHKILLLDCFFNKKQHEIIKSNFFRSREEILDKLLEKNNDTYLWYYMFRKYMIKN